MSPVRVSASDCGLLALQVILASALFSAGAFAEDTPAWDVNQPPGPQKEVPIDVSEGTWMNLDVSSDGKTIVFDLLGDLYTLPISGGEATRISAGVAWDMQPRFSPDGTKIAFTSDRAGGDNLWISGADGSDPKQVSKESYQLLNSPAWTPDGRYVAGRKHFTSRRSLGSGEVWLFPASGGGGLQMTTKPNEQKDVGEPAFSPDGKYLYYSIDQTPGGSFDYSKDSNGEIYVIRRLDRETGEDVTLVSGPGGAIRPTPSPDGRRLAFLRRVRFQTTLFLMDLDSGRIRALYDGMERDMQETWAVHGVYPTMAWTPDGGSMVFWAKGKIQRVDVSTGEVREIPFHVKDTRQVADALRFAAEVAPQTFDVKALRWVRVSPRGDQVVYQALGYLWSRALPDGEPRRLTSQEDHFEFHPSFSRDGSQIVYTTFDEQQLGAIRVVPAAGGVGRRLTTGPGHYVDPVFSPNGEQVVYGRVSGGGVVSALWSDEPGVYRVAVTGGQPTRITTRGRDPHFGARSDRVFLTTSAPGSDGDNVSLISIGMDGREERTHESSAWATDFRVSPDGGQVAFIERFRVYVAPMIATGRAVSVSPTTTSHAVRKVSDEAGENLGWSADSSTLHWSLGPNLYSARVTEEEEALADGAVPPAPKSENISFRAPYDRPTTTIALVGGRIITMNGDEVIEDGVVVIRNNRIVMVGSAATPLSAAAVHVDCRGKTLIPGLIDVHAHGQHAADGVIPPRNWQHHATLAFGVTTVHDPSHDTNSIFATAELAKAGAIVAPRIFSTGTILYGATGNFKAEVDKLDDARFHLRRLQAIGATTVKSYNQPRRDQRQQIIAAGRELGVMVVPEGGSLLQHNLTQVVDGHTGIEHSLPVENIYQDITQLWGSTAVGYTPTLIVGYGGMWGENYWYDTTDVWKNERLMHFSPRGTIDPRSRRRVRAPEEEYNHLRSAGICKALVDAGARCQLGAHGQLQGLGAHWELWMLAQGGLTPHQALRAASLDGAFYIGLDQDLGSIEPGKLADILVLDANPLDDIRASEQIHYTVLNGRVYDAHTMAPYGDEANAPRFWFDDVETANVSDTHTGCAGCTMTPEGPAAGYR